MIIEQLPIGAAETVLNVQRKRVVDARPFTEGVRHLVETTYSDGRATHTTFHRRQHGRPGESFSVPEGSSSKGEDIDDLLILSQKIRLLRTRKTE